MPASHTPDNTTDQPLEAIMQFVVTFAIVASAIIPLTAVAFVAAAKQFGWLVDATAGQCTQIPRSFAGLPTVIATMAGPAHLAPNGLWSPDKLVITLAQAIRAETYVLLQGAFARTAPPDWAMSPVSGTYDTTTSTLIITAEGIDRLDANKVCQTVTLILAEYATATRLALAA